MRILLVITSIFLFLSCTNNKFTGVSKQDDLYASYDRVLPQYKVFQAKNSAMLYFRIPVDDSSIDEPSNFNIDIRVDIYKDYTKRYLLDSMTYSVSIPQGGDLSWQNIDGDINLGSIEEFAKPYIARVNCQFGNVTFPEQLVYVDSIPSDQSNYLIMDEDGEIVFGNYLKANKKYVIVSDKFTGSNLNMKIYPSYGGLPKPPFSSYSPPPYVESAKDTAVVPDQYGIYYLSCPDNSIIVIESVDSSMYHTGINTFEDSYPSVSDVDNLIDALRYITTSDEYEAIINSHNKKEAIDKFWLACSGSKDRARKLIKEYYGRVAFSNRKFTSHVEGWKSDRGLIYVIYGPPKKVYVNSEKEFWTYGEEGKMSHVTFEFVKTASPFSNNDYRLKRNEVYKSSWYRVVGAWREGRLYY